VKNKDPVVATVRPSTPVVIGVVTGLLAVVGGAIYVFIFAHVAGGMIVQLVIVLGTAVFLGALAVVVRARLKELKEENPDDYSKY
jgi:ABC-type nickel/cobalt efflux system permease component RcnA